jgi:proline dehydrogenase
MSDEMIVAPQVGNTASLPSVTGAIEPLGILASDACVTDADMASLHEFWGRLHTLSARARDLGVRLMIDAEHCSTQPILDAMTLVLSREFNRPQPGVAVPFSGPIIFGTYQSYLRRAPQLLEAAIRDSETHGYALGIKIVRGAYFVSEREEWRAAGRAGADPIWPNKPATDSCYDTCIDTITTTLAAQISGPHPETALSVVFATHNPESVQLVLDQLEKTGLAERPLELAPDGAINPSPRLRLRDSLRSKVFLAQLYGMRDDLTDTVVDSFEPGAPVALKYIAYGKLDEVLPFLARRAIENKSIMTGEGGAAVERKRVTDELKRRWSR